LKPHPFANFKGKQMLSTSPQVLVTNGSAQLPTPKRGRGRPSNASRAEAAAAQSQITPPQAVPPDERFVNVAELARRVGAHKDTVHRWIRAGVLPPPIRINRRVIRWNASTIDAWMAAIGKASAR
jgi:excisionase family DNA binding protein